MKNKRILSLLAVLLTVAMAVSFAGNTVPETAKAASSSELQEQLDELEAENEALEAELEGLRDQLSENLEGLKQLVTQKNVVDREIALMNQQIENLNTQISACSLLIADKQEEVDAAQAYLKELQVKNKERIRTM